jgi:hypothetical protein
MVSVAKLTFMWMWFSRRAGGLVAQTRRFASDYRLSGRRYTFYEMAKES